MTTHVTTRNPVRADLDTPGADASAPIRATRRTSPGSRRGWALSGVAAGVLGIGTMVSSSMINAIYDKEIALDEDAILAELADQSTQIMAFQVIASLTARSYDSMVPMVASAGRRSTSYEVVACDHFDDVRGPPRECPAASAEAVVAATLRTVSAAIRRAEHDRRQQAGVISRTQLYAVEVTRAQVRAQVECPTLATCGIAERVDDHREP